MLMTELDRPARRAARWCWFGIGYCPSHFGEILQGAFHANDAIVRRGLVTMPYRRQGVISRVQARPGSGVVHGPLGKTKTLEAVRLYLAAHELERTVDVTFSLYDGAAEGIGLGSSTSDIVSTLRALDHALAHHTEPAEIARLAVIAEVACDSTMFTQAAVLFAQRDGIVLESFAGSLPRLSALGFNLCPGEIFLTTETAPAQYTLDEVQEFDRLRYRMRAAVKDSDAPAVARVATESARINQRYFPKATFAEFERLCERYGAMGLSVSHSGTVGALLFAPSRPSERDIHRIFADASECGIEPIEHFIV